MTGVAFVEQLEKILRGTPLSADEASLALEAILCESASETQSLAFLTSLSMVGIDERTLGAMANTLREHLRLGAIESLSGAELVIAETATSNRGWSAEAPTSAAQCPNAPELLLTASFVAAGAGVKVLFAPPLTGPKALSPTWLQDTLRNPAVANATSAQPPTPEGEWVRVVDFSFLERINERIGYAVNRLPIPTVLDLIVPIAMVGENSALMLQLNETGDAEMIVKALLSFNVKDAVVLRGGPAAANGGSSRQYHQISRGVLKRTTGSLDLSGASSAALLELATADATQKQAMLKGVLDGEHGPLRDAVGAYSAIGIIACSKAESAADGLRLAFDSIDSGRARAALADAKRVP